jgi:hypothetical protein
VPTPRRSLVEGRAVTESEEIEMNYGRGGIGIVGVIVIVVVILLVLRVIKI